jgi:hypothetical protein
LELNLARFTRSTSAVAAAGSRSHPTPETPKATSNGVASSGPAAYPAFPPTANTLITVAVRSPLAWLAARADSGWNAATPRPLRRTAATIHTYEGATATRAMPAPAANRPAGMTHGADLVSANQPKAGCTTEDRTVAAITRPPAAANVRPRSITRNGSSAGTTPWLTSLKKCPPVSRPTARRSGRRGDVSATGARPAFTDPLLDPASRLRAL